MSLGPLLAAPLAIQVHVAATWTALLLSPPQLLMRKGASLHRVLGFVWMLAMVVAAVSSFFIHTIRTFGPYSPIHLLSIVTLVAIPVALLAVRAGNIRRHRFALLTLFWTALVGAGLFTLLPGRLMNALLTG